MKVITFKSLKMAFVVCIGLLILIPSSYGQDVLTSKGKKSLATLSEREEAVPHRHSHHKKLSASFSGYMIELIQSDVPLSRAYPLFNHYGNIYYSKMRDGKYSYSIAVQFATRKEMRKFLNNVVKPNAPDAKLVFYRTGKRKVLK